MRGQQDNHEAENNNELYDVIVVGAGPAGITASIYATRAALKVVCIEQQQFGGRINLTNEIDNYPAFEHVTGAELAEAFHNHAEHCGTSFVYDSLTKIEKEEKYFICLGQQGRYKSKVLIYAAGNSPRKAGFINEEKFIGRGVSYCATCDAAFYKGKTVFVVGGGDSACVEAEHLTHFAAKVIMLIRSDSFRAKRALVKRVAENPQIEVRFNTRIAELEGDTLPQRIVMQDTLSHETSVYSSDPGSFGIFIFAGNDPNVSLVKDLVELDNTGAIITDDRMKTKTEGLYAAGDVRNTVLRQIVTATADGAIAATEASTYLDFQQQL